MKIKTVLTNILLESNTPYRIESDGFDGHVIHINDTSSFPTLNKIIKGYEKLNKLIDKFYQELSSLSLGELLQRKYGDEFIKRFKLYSDQQYEISMSDGKVYDQLVQELAHVNNIDPHSTTIEINNQELDLYFGDLDTFSTDKLSAIEPIIDLIEKSLSDEYDGFNYEKLFPNSQPIDIQEF
jgi:hypothetical protein